MQSLLELVMNNADCKQLLRLLLEFSFFSSKASNFRCSGTSELYGESLCHFLGTCPVAVNSVCMTFIPNRCLFSIFLLNGLFKRVYDSLCFKRSHWRTWHIYRFSIGVSENKLLISSVPCLWEWVGDSIKGFSVDLSLMKGSASHQNFG